MGIMRSLGGGRCARWLVLAFLAAVFITGCPRKPADQELIFTFSAGGELRPFLSGSPLFSSRKSAEAFSELAPSLAARDLVMVDFAGALNLGCQPLIRDEVLRWDPDWLDHLAEANIRVLNLADDHALDCGREALSQAINRVLARGFYVAGAGHGQKEARAPIYLTRSNVTISVASFLLDEPPGIDPCKDCTGPSIYDRSAMINSLQEMKARAAYHVVVFHFKERDLPELTEDEVDVIHEAVDFGADLVIGYGPASAGGLYRIRGRWVIGSMGRLAGDASDDPEKIADGLLVSAEFTPDKMMGLRVVAVQLDEGRPRLVRGEEGSAALAELRAASDPEIQDSSTLIGDILYLK